MEEDKAKSGYMQLQLEKLFNLAWMLFYQGTESQTADRYYRDIYEDIRNMIAGVPNVDKDEYERTQTAMLKLWDELYEAIVNRDYKARALGSGLNSEVAKEVLHQKAFGGWSEEDLGQINEELSEEDSQSHPQQSTEDGQDINLNSNGVIDFDKLYDPRLIGTLQDGKKNIQYKAIDSRMQDAKERRIGNTNIIIMPVGVLRYTTAFKVEKYITKYSIIMRKGEGENIQSIQRNVFGNIDTVALKYDKAYNRAAAEQLLTLENIDREGNEGYIGELVPKEGTSNEYELDYSNSREDYSAVKCYNEERKRELEQAMQQEGKEQERGNR